MSTNIEWTDEVWNPVVGCARVSPGCENWVEQGGEHAVAAYQPLMLEARACREGRGWRASSSNLDPTRSS
ncbi:MAG: DUF5131 family protein [Acidimicrobiia bacterium]|nr:MAG: DUF5131 family protein [Acidimicrobiia bacterium]